MLTKTNVKTKCDVLNCKNLAVCYLPAKGKLGKLFLCEQCLAQLAAEVHGHRPPKSPKNTIKKVMDEKEKEAYNHE